MLPIKFLPKKPQKTDPSHKGLVVYYSRMDIVLGLILICLSGFFIYKYFQYSLQPPSGYSPLVTVRHINRIKAK